MNIKAIEEAFEHANKLAEAKFKQEVFETRVNFLAIIMGLGALGVTTLLIHKAFWGTIWAFLVSYGRL